MKPGRPFPRGFTLIEVMMVVAIIGLTLTMGLPAFLRVLKKEGMYKAEYELVEAVPVQYKIWAGLARTEAEFVIMKPRWMARTRDSLHDALWDAMQIIDGGRETVWEIEGDDGSSIGRQEVIELVHQRRWELAAKPPQKY